jgi:Lrp/AsnC family transcriptional regulator, leucine-responsive regulatory protein
MEEAGIITGYHAAVDLRAVGLPVLALIQLRSFVGQNCRQVIAKASELPEVLATYHTRSHHSVVV